MSEAGTPRIGSVAWFDLTVPEAERVKDFYTAVVGWEAQPVDMGEYHDYNMIPPEGSAPAAGICHARGTNAGVPPVWMNYVVVADIQCSLARCAELGGSVVDGPKDLGSYGTVAVIRDPAGAVLALWEQKTA